ncbi:MAG: hypothetical protein M3425_01210 [Actinomycetota bacterium]|nr:hypothetical protein [Actinomycetota bacterium]
MPQEIVCVRVVVGVSPTTLGLVGSVTSTTTACRLLVAVVPSGLTIASLLAMMRNLSPLGRSPRLIASFW